MKDKIPFIKFNFIESCVSKNQNCRGIEKEENLFHFENDENDGNDSFMKTIDRKFSCSYSKNGFDNQERITFLRNEDGGSGKKDDYLCEDFDKISPDCKHKHHNYSEQGHIHGHIHHKHHDCDNNEEKTHPSFKPDKGDNSGCIDGNKKPERPSNDNNCKPDAPTVNPDNGNDGEITIPDEPTVNPDNGNDIEDSPSCEDDSILDDYIPEEEPEIF